jgi:hypothetical protein
VGRDWFCGCRGRGNFVSPASPACPDHAPRLTEAVAVVGTHLRPLRRATVQFGLDKRCDVDAVDQDVLQFAAYLDVDELDAAHPHPGEVDSLHLGVPKTDALKTRSGEVLAMEPGHRHDARGVDV